MQTRILGRTGRPVSVIGLGTWQLGADWGEVDPADARAVLETSLEAGVTFYDTADVYGDGRSERFLPDEFPRSPALTSPACVRCLARKFSFPTLQATGGLARDCHGGTADSSQRRQRVRHVKHPGWPRSAVAWRRSRPETG